MLSACLGLEIANIANMTAMQIGKTTSRDMHALTTVMNTTIVARFSGESLLAYFHTFDSNTFTNFNYLYSFL